MCENAGKGKHSHLALGPTGVKQRALERQSATEYVRDTKKPITAQETVAAVVEHILRALRHTRPSRQVIYGK